MTTGKTDYSYRAPKSKPRQYVFESLFQSNCIKNKSFLRLIIWYLVICLVKSEGTKYIHLFYVTLLRNSVLGAKKLDGFGNRVVHGLNKSKNTASTIFTFIIFMVSSLIAGYNDLPPAASSVPNPIVTFPKQVITNLVP